ncbi:hypothetical protein NEFER03_1302 [Nematocida sp. LUAm3]|nr:hypothetical protein NEFER03_1302 [Nematocida sp. LUAm3]KAI5174076.1 hypothetical protein NEFER02_0543 [Nematocida sp. LUAm2]KAI5177181.1 hypothetical protein NEFER01_0456 [Nematocida sp. LUAm1]
MTKEAPAEYKGVRAIISALQHFSLRKRKDKEFLQRIGERIGSKLPLILLVDRTEIFKRANGHSWVASQMILPSLGIIPLGHGASTIPGKQIVKIRSLWLPSSPDTLSLLSYLLHRLYEGWYTPSSVSIQTSRLETFFLISPEQKF